MFGLSENDVRILRELFQWWKQNKGRPIPPARRHPRLQGSSGGGAAAAEIVNATVIQAPIYADPASFSLSGGRAFYTLRLLTDTTAAYNAATSYLENDYCIATNNLMYKATAVTPNEGNEPSVSPTYWTATDEIKVEHALGADSLDLRLFNPGFIVGAVVPITSRVIEAVTRYYINATLTYGGTDAQASLRWNQTENRAMACFK